ncbi:hypothetical protein [Streptomyces sp. LN590]|uniref:hypothetical protein n=1 Tax=unclassified Streptomyces TaxID=2593676 RepID=UPI00371E42CC
MACEEPHAIGSGSRGQARTTLEHARAAPQLTGTGFVHVGFLAQVPWGDYLIGDLCYFHDKYRRLVRALGVKPVIARRKNSGRASVLATVRLVPVEFLTERHGNRLQ